MERGLKTKPDDEKNRIEQARRAEMRAAELRPSMNMLPVSKLHIDASVVPFGWEYKWVRVSCMSIPDYQNENESLSSGYTPVPADRHPELARRFSNKGQSNTEGFIVKEGLMLCEIPKSINDEKRQFFARMNTEKVTSLESLKNGLGMEPTMPGQVFAAQTSPGFTSNY